MTIKYCNTVAANMIAKHTTHHGCNSAATRLQKKQQCELPAQNRNFAAETGIKHNWNTNYATSSRAINGQ